MGEGGGGWVGGEVWVRLRRWVVGGQRLRLDWEWRWLVGGGWVVIPGNPSERRAV